MDELSRIVQHHPGLILRLNIEGVVLSANTAAQRLLHEAQLEGRSWFDIVPSISAEQWRLFVRSEAALTIEDQTTERCLALCHVFDAAEQSVYVYGEDMSERKKSEQELLRQQAIVSNVARFPHMNPAPVLQMKPDGQILLSNKAAARVFGENLGSKNWRELCPGIDDLYWNGVLHSSELSFLHVDFGDACFVFSHQFDAESDVVFVFGSEVTELELAQRDLARQKSELAEIARFPDMNPGPVLRMDYDGCILLCNTASQILFGIDLKGKNWLGILPGLSDQHWKKILASAKVELVEVVLNGRAFVFHHRVDPKTDLVFVFGTDITLQRLAEQTLRQSERMATLGTLAAGVAHELNNPAAAATRAAQQLELTFRDLQTVRMNMDLTGLLAEENEVLIQLVAQASAAAEHEEHLSPLRRAEEEEQLENWMQSRHIAEGWKHSPSLVRMGHRAQTLPSLLSTVRPACLGLIIEFSAHVFQMYTLMHEIHEGSTRISEIVGALKNYSFLGQAPIQNVDVHAGIDNTLVILRNKMKGGVEIERHYAEDLPRITAFGSELNQVWTNIIDNAIEAMQSNGNIIIRSLHEGEHVVIEIEDNGPGIPEHIQSRIFDPFFTTKEPGKGTGLGLSTTYGIVAEKHKGSISVDSRPGKTVFTVRLPIQGDIRDGAGDT